MKLSDYNRDNAQRVVGRAYDMMMNGRFARFYNTVVNLICELHDRRTGQKDISRLRLEPSNKISATNRNPETGAPSAGDSPANLKYTIPDTPGLEYHKNLVDERLSRSDDDTFWRDLGYCLYGPFCLSFISFVRGEAERAGADRIMFVSDSGRLMHELYSSLEEGGIGSVCANLNPEIGMAAFAEHYGDENRLWGILSMARDPIPRISVTGSYESNLDEYNAFHDEITASFTTQREELIGHLAQLKEGSERMAVADATSPDASVIMDAAEGLGNVPVCSLSAFNPNQGIMGSHALFDEIDPADRELARSLLGFLDVCSGQAVIETGGYASEVSLDVCDGIRQYAEDVRQITDAPAMDPHVWNELSRNFAGYCSDGDIGRISAFESLFSAIAEYRNR